MNIWQRFKNWLIEKMGGYTEEEYEKAKKIAWETGADYQKSIDGVWRTTACRMGANYTAEHEAYLALLNCHNATAEAAQNVAIAADTIKDYCANRADCDGCPLHGECGCKTADKACPEYWD